MNQITIFLLSIVFVGIVLTAYRVCMFLFGKDEK